ncbi:toll/interleukin-1 receptor domain-containing protein [Paracoccus sphaerophysae]|uniref:toll/interleukin-1 receptor domain-containing protein n=1 Tax=Paracoccus sphaerophysae TaxID=690417 RepID=UPI0018DE42B4|nr:toll/interleukin-1 receptor domain-containing protein [Paracoccus sphaerophysae]
MTNAFISYVRENSAQADYLKKVLEKNGVTVWLDRDKLTPGVRWKDAIERAIRGGMYFISLHSKERETRDKSYAHEELTVAVEEIRQRSTNKAWFLGVRLDDSPIPDRRIGGGELLSDLQFVDIRNWPHGIIHLLAAMGVENPVVDHRAPLAPCIAPEVAIVSGYLRYVHMQSAPEIWQGMEHRISGGWCRREDDGRILGQVTVAAPLAQVQHVNDMLGTGVYDIQLEGNEISADPARPTKLTHAQRITLPQGTPIPDVATGRNIILPIDFPILSQMVGEGWLEGRRFKGKFTSTISPLRPMPGLVASLNQEGLFELVFEDRLPRDLEG